jgi:hypothetical protein
MFKQSLLIASAAAATLVAVPGAAEARHRSYYGGGYAQPYYGSSYGYYPQSYGQQAYGYGYQQPYYGGSQRYYGQRYYGHRRHRCGNGTTGLIVGGAAGALLGREVERSGSRHRYYGRRSGGTTGAIIGGAVGALVGRGIARSC